MAQMNRNVNLEEIDSDALFGIDALKNQSPVQKVIFYGCIAAGVLANVLLPLYCDAPKMACVAVFMVLLLTGVAFGCNYTEDMTYGKYLYCLLFKPSTHLYFDSTEDVTRIREGMAELKKEEEAVLMQHKRNAPEEQKKLLVRVAAFAIAVTVITASALVYKNLKNRENIHHTVEQTEETDEER